MRKLWFITSLIPIPFFFHLYEYNVHNELFLFIGFIVCIFTLGLLSKNVKLLSIILVNIIMSIISLVLGYLFIPNDTSWFVPFGRNTAVCFISVVYLTSQLTVKKLLNRI